MIWSRGMQKKFYSQIQENRGGVIDRQIKIFKKADLYMYGSSGDTLYAWIYINKTFVSDIQQ